jgi:hypothetical protein
LLSERKGMKIGITGTEYGCSDAQLKSLVTLLWDIHLVTEIIEFHHGSCVGVDVEAAYLVSFLIPRPKIHCHPPIKKILEGQSGVDDIVYRPKSYIERNHSIVVLTDLLIAVPAEISRQPRGGTWNTYTFAERMDKPRIIIWPDGTVERLNDRS